MAPLDGATAMLGADEPEPIREWRKSFSRKVVVLCDVVVDHPE
jgi:hypothetical protein